MITQDKIRHHLPVVERAVRELLRYCIEHEVNSGDFVLFLENGHIDDSAGIAGFSKYVVGPSMKGIQDYDRIEFFELYIAENFQERYDEAPSDEIKKRISRFSLNLELMIYSHFWEAYMNLRAWRQLAGLANGEGYLWETTIPDVGRSNFIRNEIKQVFINKQLDIANVFASSYHSQLRNAFAHSEYSILSDRIELANYKGANWELSEISFDEWEDRFVITALLYDQLAKLKQAYVRSIGEAKKVVSVTVPNEKGRGVVVRQLAYHEAGNRFVWKTNHPDHEK